MQRRLPSEDSGTSLRACHLLVEMRFQSVSYPKFWLSLPIALCVAQSVVAQGVPVIPIAGWHNGVVDSAPCTSFMGRKAPIVSENNRERAP
jgi:hypothetical protein